MLLLLLTTEKLPKISSCSVSDSVVTVNYQKYSSVLIVTALLLLLDKTKAIKNNFH